MDDPERTNDKFAMQQKQYKPQNEIRGNLVIPRRVQE